MDTGIPDDGWLGVTTLISIIHVGSPGISTVAFNKQLVKTLKIELCKCTLRSLNLIDTVAC